MFRTVPLPIIRNFSLYTQQWYMSYRFADSLRAGSGRNSVLILLVSCMTYTYIYIYIYVPLLCVQWKTPVDGQRNFPKSVEFYSKNKFEKLVHLVGFIIRILWLYVWMLQSVGSTVASDCGSAGCRSQPQDPDCRVCLYFSVISYR